MKKQRSFKKLEKDIIICLGRYGYEFYQKLNDLEATDTRIYVRGFHSGCTVSTHRSDICSITISFSTNYIQMTYSALAAITFDSNAEIQYVLIDHTADKHYSSMLAEIKSIIEKD
jgi:hypothetical protein